jgi:hypothetical protein
MSLSSRTSFLRSKAGLSGNGLAGFATGGGPIQECTGRRLGPGVGPSAWSEAAGRCKPWSSGPRRFRVQALASATVTLT